MAAYKHMSNRAFFLNFQIELMAKKKAFNLPLMPKTPTELYSNVSLCIVLTIDKITFLDETTKTKLFVFVAVRFLKVSSALLIVQ